MSVTDGYYGRIEYDSETKTIYLHANEKGEEMMRELEELGMTFDDFMNYLMDNYWWRGVEMYCRERPGTIGAKLYDWLDAHSLGRRPRTVEFNEQVVLSMVKNWEAFGVPLVESPDKIILRNVLDFAKVMNRFCSSRWNATVSALKFLTPHGDQLRRKPLRFRQYTPPSKEELAKVLEELDQCQRTNAGLALRFLVLSGLRFAEYSQLRWEDIGQDRITVRSGTTKNGKTRVVPFLEGMAEVIDKLRCRKAEEKCDSPLVFPKPYIRKSVSRACKKIGVHCIAYHGARHTFITRCVMSGVPVPVVSRWAGHSDGGSLLSRMYFHLVESQSFEMAQKARIL